MNTPTTYYSPDGNPEVWLEQPDGYFTVEEWLFIHPPGADASEEGEEREESATQQREHAYQMEADHYRNQAISYYVEAVACRLDQDLELAKNAEAKMNAALRRYREIKQSIRESYPDPEPEQYIVSPTGVYHSTVCGALPQNGESMVLSAIALAYPEARPCGKCNPPTLG